MGPAIYKTVLRKFYFSGKWWFLQQNSGPPYAHAYEIVHRITTSRINLVISTYATPSL